MGANQGSIEPQKFNYSAEAELFPPRSRKSGTRCVGYRRFEHAADAIRFAVEEIPRDLLVGACLEVTDVRLDSREILRLYESIDFPLARRAAARFR